MRRQIDSTPGIVNYFGSSFWHRGSATPVIVAFLGVLAVRSKNGQHDGTVRLSVAMLGQIICGTVLRKFFCLPRGHGCFFLSSLVRKFESCLLKLCFFLVLGLTFEGLLDRYGHHFGPQKASEKSGCQRKPKTAKREKRIPNLRTPVGSARKRLRISHVLSTMMALLKNSRAGGSGYKFRLKKHCFFNAKYRQKYCALGGTDVFFEGLKMTENDHQKWSGTRLGVPKKLPHRSK